MLILPTLPRGPSRPQDLTVSVGRSTGRFFVQFDPEHLKNARQWHPRTTPLHSRYLLLPIISTELLDSYVFAADYNYFSPFKSTSTASSVLSSPPPVGQIPASHRLCSASAHKSHMLPCFPCFPQNWQCPRRTTAATEREFLFFTKAVFLCTCSWISPLII